MQQMFLGLGASATKTYIDNIFDTTLYVGNESSTTVTTGIDLATDGGLIIGKSRGGAHAPFFYDTVRGVQKYLRSDVTAGEVTLSTGLTAFSTTGFSVGSHVGMNDDVKNAAWSFKKTPGFFDVITYTGTGSATTISHNLGSVPGFIMVKKTSSAGNWCCYHSSLGATKFIKLDQAYGALTSSDRWNDTEPTSSVFSIGTHAQVNTSGASYVAYLFAGGESTAATARSVDFDGNDYLASSSSDYVCGTGDFTIELWFKTDSTSIQRLCDRRTGSNTNAGVLSIWQNASGISQLYWHIDGSNGPIIGGSIEKGQWYHAAVVRHSSTTKLYLNGKLVGTLSSDTTDYDSAEIYLGEAYPGQGSYNLVGKISNFRLVVGTAVYTSSFRPPTQPLTNITNTKLLCCNNSSTTGKTTGGTITANGDPTASTDSPFDDPAGFVFGNDEDQNVIKTGSYLGTGSAGIEVNIGWEPQLILIKAAADGENWEIYDSMRGISDGLNRPDKRLRLNAYSAEDDNPGFFSLRPNGFIVDGTSGSVNTNGVTFLFLAIRRPDGYVGKPADAGTDVFNTVDGDTDGVAPFFKNIGFPVDLALFKNKTNSSHNWGTSPRLTQGYYLSANQTRSENANSHQVFDYMSAWNSGTDTNGGYFSYAWKRHAGFDCLVYTGNGVAGLTVPHNLNATPEMIWVKNRNDGNRSWIVYHKDLDSSAPEDKYLVLNNTNAAQDDTFWNDTAPTTTHFTVGAYSEVNDSTSGRSHFAALFASVNGISKVGSYTGSGSSNTQTITTGFQPRFVIIRDYTANSNPWYVMDTLRGWASGNDKQLMLNSTDAELTNDWGAPTSTGFTVTGSGINLNTATQKYIYYAHA